MPTRYDDVDLMIEIARRRPDYVPALRYVLEEGEILTPAAKTKVEAALKELEEPVDETPSL